jgi:hypothetical protein
VARRSPRPPGSNPWQADLRSHRPCAEGFAYVVDNGIASQAEAFAKTTRPDWYLWLAQTYRVRLDHKTLVTFACDCAERALPIFEAYHPDDPRPRHAIESARKWTTDSAPIGEVRTAKRAAANSAYLARRAAEESAKLGETSDRAAFEAAKCAAVAAAAKSAKRAAGSPDVFKPYDIAFAGSDASDAVFALGFAYAAAQGDDPDACHAYARSVAEVEQEWQANRLRDLFPDLEDARSIAS